MRTAGFSEMCYPLRWGMTIGGPDVLEKTLLVAAGSALGGVARYWAGILASLILRPDLFSASGPQFPWDTVLVNISGSFAIGLLAVMTSSEHLRLFLMIGLCGGFTTFSSFSLQTVMLISSDRIGLAAVNIFGSLVLCLLATSAGIALGRQLAA